MKCHIYLIVISLFIVFNPNFSFCTVTNSNEVSDSIRILSFNILYGGDEIDYNKVIELIKKANPDVIGFQEAEGNIPKIAKSLGWKYYDSRLHLMSKYPIISQKSSAWYYVLLEVRPGHVFAFSNIHLPSDPYGPDLIKNGSPIDSVIKNEYLTRYHELDKFEKIYDSLYQAEIPLIVTGDFNSPSHRDWIDATVNLRPHLKYKVDWIVSKRMEEMGFIDTYREANPDVLKNPGLTWTPASPPIVPANETHDRIDYIWASNIEKVIHSTLIGEEGGKDVTFSVSPYPSDHRGVLTTCLIKPVLSNAYIQPFKLKDSLLLRFFSIDNSNLSIQLFDKKGALYKSFQMLNINENEKKLKIEKGESYRIQLKNNDSVIAENYFHPAIDKKRPFLKLAKNEYKEGEPISIKWENAPGHRFDWIAIYPAGKETSNDFYKTEPYTTYLLYSYTYASESGSLILGKQSKGNGWPLKAGQYRIHLLLDDGYRSLVDIPLKVTK